MSRWSTMNFAKNSVMPYYIERELHELEYKLVEESALFVVNIRVLEPTYDSGDKTGDVSISCLLLKKHLDQECYHLNFYHWLGVGPRNELREICELLVLYLDEAIVESTAIQ